MAEQAPQTTTSTVPSRQTRFFAFLIDGLIVSVLGFIPFIGSIIGAGYMLVRDGLSLDFANGRSIGKHIMKIKPVRLDGKPMDIATSISRNWVFALGALASLLLPIPLLGLLVALAGSLLGLYEAYLTYKKPDGRRYGDRFAGTQVVTATDEN